MYIFKTKIPIWVNFEGSCIADLDIFNGKFGIFYGYMVSLSVLMYCTKKNLATLEKREAEIYILRKNPSLRYLPCHKNINFQKKITLLGCQNINFT
jgi:hypothetical protein